MSASLFLSLTTYDIVQAPRFVGLANYVTAFSTDPLFWTSLLRTFYYAGLSVPLAISASLILALFLNRKFVGVTWARAIYFMPHLVPVVAATVIWVWILNPQIGLLNQLLSVVGVRGPSWFGTPEWAIPALIILGLWRSAGGNTMIIFLAGLQTVPRELHDAAEVDGANAWQRFRHVTLAIVSPTIFFNLVLGIIGALKVFSTAFIATGGGPAYATWFYALHLYKNAFEFFKMGYASALAWIFLVIVVSLTWVQFRASSRWVYYEGEVR